MAKKSKRTKRAEPSQKKITKNSINISHRKQDYIFLAIITVLLIYLLKPMVIDGLSPQGVDVVAAKGKSHQFVQWNKESGEKALWNPAIFAGMPQYYDYSPVAFSIDNILVWFSKFASAVFLYYLIGALGMFMFLRYLKLPPLIAFIATLMFILMPHYKALWITGHFRKFRALMYLPWILLAFKHFENKKNILSAALFAIAFGIQIRTQHYQIIFYTGLMIFAVGVYPFLKLLIQKDYSRFSKSFILLTASLALAVLMSAQPLFLAKEYLPYSKRGKTTISLSDKTRLNEANSKDGVKIGYATQWSTHPTETLTWLIPHFYGGMSQEKYTGKEAPQLKGMDIPSYWGFMPFTQSFEYMGILTLLFATIGAWFFRKNNLIKSLAFFSLFLVLLSFGRHFTSFYELFFNYVPFFNKFRAPMMSVTINFFIFSVFAAFGLKYLYEISIGKMDLQAQKFIFYIMGGFFFLGLIIWLFSQGFSFSSPGDSRYAQQTVALFKTARKELFNQDLVRYFLLIGLSAGIVFAYLKKKISFVIMGIVIAIVTSIDLIDIQSKTGTNYTDPQKLEKQYFRKTATDLFLTSDKEIFRMLPAGKSFSSNRDGYFHQSIGGYSPTKMYTIEELIENNLYNSWDKKLPINTNVLQILNVKYIVTQANLVHNDFQLVNVDNANKLNTYLYLNHLPRGYFVKGYKIITDEYERLEFINTPAFTPSDMALLEEKPLKVINAPDSTFSKLTNFTPNIVEFDTYTDKQSLFVISELFYPPGWVIYIDNDAVKQVLKTNHAVQSIVVPAGNHKIKIAFEPASYYRNIKIASVSVSILYLSIIISLFLGYRNRKRLNV